MKSQVTTFAPDSILVKQLFEVFKSLTDKYKFSVLLPDLRIKTLPIVSQYIDTYGKLRVINTSTNGHVVTIVTDPLPPVSKPISSKIYRVKIGSIKKMIQTYSFTPVLQRVSRRTGKTKELVLMIGSVSGTFLIDEDTERLPNVKVEIGEHFEVLTENDLESNLEIFNSNRFVTKNLVQYTLKSASEFFLKYKSLDLKKFSDEMFLLDEAHEYDVDKLRAIFTPNSSLVKNGKLVVKSEEMLKRLLFVVRLFKERHSKNFKQYADYVKIPDFYHDISDYKLYENEYLLEGIDAIENMLNSEKIIKKSQPFILTDDWDPYFFKNDIVSNKVYLAQNVISFREGARITETWRTEGYNLGVAKELIIEGGEEETKRSWKRAPESKEIKKYDLRNFNVYKYINQNDISLLVSNAEVRDALLGYIVNGAVRYTVLLNFF